MTLPTQLFVGERPDPAKLRPVENRDHWKPTGGLWTSTYSDGGSGWTRWTEENEFRAEGEYWLLEPERGARILTVRNTTDFERALERFRAPGRGRDYLRNLGPLDARIDWSAVADRYDGFRLTEGAIWSSVDGGLPLRLASLLVNVWDCESTLWFRWRFASVERVDADSRS